MSEVVASPAPPLTDEELQAQLKLQVVDVSDAVQTQAVDNAERYLSDQTNRRGPAGFIKRIWQGNIARDFYRQREIQRGRHEIAETGNIYALADGSQAEHNEAMAAVVERFSSDFIHDGENNQNFEDAEHGQGLTTQLQELVSAYASGDIDHDGLTEERTRLLGDFGRVVHGEDRNRGLIYADNLLLVAANARAAFEQGVAIERLNAAISGQLGEARTGVRTEIRLEMTDRILDRLHSNRVGSLVNETTLGLAAASAMTVAKLTTRKLFTAASVALSLGAASGVIAGAREHLRVGQERTSHARQMAEGGQVEDGSRRRDQMERTRYESVSAAELTGQIHQMREALEPGDQAALQVFIETVTAARVRVQESDVNSIDLLEYSSKTSVETERLALDIELAQARVLIDEMIALTPLNLNSELLEEAVREQIASDVELKDQVFNRLRRNRTIRMGLIGAATGLAVGLGGQEIHALIDNSLQGVGEAVAGTNRHTLLADVFGNNNQSVHGVENLAGSHREMYEGGHHLHDFGVDLPAGYHLVDSSPKGPNGWEIVGPDGKPLVQNVTWDTQGKLSLATRHVLSEQGFKFVDHNNLKFHELKLTEHSVERSPGGYLAHHSGRFTHVQRELWYDNNTSGVYDQNELKLWWGGGTGSGIDSHGNYVFNVAHMTQDGSFHGGESANAQQLIGDGRIKIALSMTKGSQAHVFMVNVDANGNATIPHDSFIGKSLFENQDGHAHFKGAFAEASQVLSKNHDGSVNVRMLATVVGDNSPKHALDVAHHLVRHNYVHHVTEVVAPPVQPETTPIEIPGVIPIYGRRGLETLGASQEPSRGSYYGYAGESYIGGREGRRRTEAPFARELENNPDAKIDANKSAKLYLKSFRPVYKSTVDKLSRELANQQKAEKPKLVIMIPAAAHQEGGNIYRSLTYYAKQKEVSRNDYEIVVFANNPKGTQRDKTILEIERFRRNYPDVRVKIIQKELEKEESKIGWVRKAMADAVISDLMDRGIDLNEVLLASNDADSQWIDPRYVKTILNKAEQQPEVDGFLGFIDWSYDAYNAHPETLAATRFMQMIDMYLRRKQSQIGSSGANFIYRPGIYTAVGGYKSETPLGEDVELGRMIKGVRSGANTRRPIAFLGRSSEINTSARRALDKLQRDGGAPIAQWDNFGANDELRTKKFDMTRFNFNDPVAVEDLVKSTERMLNQTLKVYDGSFSDKTPTPYEPSRLSFMDGETLRNVNRMLSVIGVSIKWNSNGSFRIVDAKRMISNLERWQAAHPATKSTPPVIAKGQLRRRARS